jgi:glycosyltransferase involved in cell wall biosynthesis
MTHSKKRRILFISRELTLGGAAFLTVRYINRLIPYFDIDLLIVGPTDPIMVNLLSGEAGIYTISNLHDKRPVDALDCFNLVLEHAESAPFHHTYDVGIATSVFPDWGSCIVFSKIRAAKKLTFLVDESLSQYPFLESTKQACVDACIRSTDIFLPVSLKLWKKMSEVYPLLHSRPLQVMKPLIDLIIDHNLSIPIQRDIPVVLTVARLSAEKQILESLYIHHGLINRGVNFRWYVIGSGPQEELIRAEIGRLEMTDYFILLGSMDNSNVFTWMKNCDIFALLSSSEGCPTVVMEALTMCCAVIATDVNGVDELIKNGLTGMIVPNTIKDISDGLEGLILDEKKQDYYRKNLEINPKEKEFLKDFEWLTDEIRKPTKQQETTASVTILIITFNQETSISRAISSALMQDFEHLEVVVVDDASTDQTGENARLWEHNPRFRYIRNDFNLGRVRNYRKALEVCAQSEWVLMLDGDDYLTDPGFLSEAWSRYQEFSSDSVVMIQAGHRVYYENGAKKNIDILPGFSEPAKLMRGGEYLKFVYDTGFFTHLGTLFRRQQAVDIGCYTADISSSDMEGLLRLALEGDVLVLNRIAGCWVQHKKNTSSTLDFNDVLANVRLFRTVANQASQRGNISLKKINPALTKYEANTLASLFFITLSNKPIRPVILLRMVQIAYKINPGLLFQRRIQSSLFGYFKKTIKYVLNTKLVKKKK